jgi:arabinose-5-phosphate isomerase
MTTHPRMLFLDALACDALNIMEKHQITVLPIVNIQQKIQGILHLHDILGKGDFKFNGH